MKLFLLLLIDCEKKNLIRVITKKSVNSVMNERTLLSELKHPYNIIDFDMHSIV